MSIKQEKIETRDAGISAGKKILMGYALSWTILHFAWIVATFYLASNSLGQQRVWAMACVTSWAVCLIIGLLILSRKTERIDRALELIRKEGKISTEELKIVSKMSIDLPIFGWGLYLVMWIICFGLSHVFLWIFGPFGSLATSSLWVGGIAGAIACPPMAMGTFGVLSGAASRTFSLELQRRELGTEGKRFNLRTKWMVSFLGFALGYTVWLGGLGHYTGVNKTIDEVRSYGLVYQGAIVDNIKMKIGEVLTVETLKPIIDKIKLGKEGFAFLADGRGNIVYNPKEDIFVKGWPDINNNLIEGIKSGQPGSIYENVGERIICYSPINERYILGTVSYLQERAPRLYAYWGWLGVFVLGAAICSLADVYTLAIWTSGSIARVSLVLKKITGGDFTKRVPTETEDEVGDLVANCNVMTVALQDYKEKLEQSKTEIENIIQSQSDLVFVIDTKGVIVKVNKAVLDALDYKVDEIVDKPAALLFHPDSMEKDIEGGPKRSLRGEIVANAELALMSKDGEKRLFTFNGTPLKDVQGKIIGAIGVGRDLRKMKKLIDDLKQNLRITQSLRDDFDRARQKAEAATEAKSEFLANMSHEIRTPMNAIVGFCDLLQKTSLDKRQEDYVNTLHSSGQLLCSVINGILDFSKLESGKVVLEAIDFNLHYLVEDTVNIISARITKDTVKINIDIDQDLPQNFKGDPTKVRQVLLNLMGNALKFTSQGEIRVIVQKEQEHSDEGIAIRFTVKDTGIGIPQESLKYVFEPFQQADTSTTRKYGGTGLGLTISKSMVEAMGGKIWVKSQEGKGSEFIFSIKLHKGISVVHKEIYPIATEKLAGLKVLIVDDSQISREILKKICDSLKMEVISAEHSGIAALGELNKLYAQENLPDLILSDIRMEEMSGFELTEKIRMNKRHDSVKIIAVSSEAYDGQANKARAKGFDGYLSKPFNKVELVKVMTAVLGDKREGGPIVTRHMANELGCKGIKVLVAEDNQPNQMLMSEYSKELGYENDFANNGQEAIDKLKEGNIYDMILMDLHMPVLGGIEATEIIRKEISKDIPIVALTAAVLGEDRKNAEDAGMNDFLTKPIDINRLKEKIIRYGRKG